MKIDSANSLWVMKAIVVLSLVAGAALSVAQSRSVKPKAMVIKLDAEIRATCAY